MPPVDDYLQLSRRQLGCLCLSLALLVAALVFSMWHAGAFSDSGPRPSAGASSVGANQEAGAVDLARVPTATSTSVARRTQHRQWYRHRRR